VLLTRDPKEWENALSFQKLLHIHKWGDKADLGTTVHSTLELLCDGNVPVLSLPRRGAPVHQGDLRLVRRQRPAGGRAGNDGRLEGPRVRRPLRPPLLPADGSLSSAT
jgi:hypothetical protein